MPMTVGDIFQSVGPWGLALSFLLPAVLLAGILVLILAKDVKWVRLYLVVAILPMLLGLVAKSTSEERREEVAARHDSITAEDLEGLPVMMGMVTTVPAVGIGLVGLIIKSGKRRRPKPKPTPREPERDPLEE